MVEIDITGELAAWFRTDEAKNVIAHVFRDVLKEELKTLLKDDLVDVREAAGILGMSEPALRKAVERGQIQCVRIGRRLRFRRADLLQR